MLELHTITFVRTGLASCIGTPAAGSLSCRGSMFEDIPHFGGKRMCSRQRRDHSTCGSDAHCWSSRLRETGRRELPVSRAFTGKQGGRSSEFYSRNGIADTSPRQPSTFHDGVITRIMVYHNGDLVMGVAKIRPSGTSRLSSTHRKTNTTSKTKFSQNPN